MLVCPHLFYLVPQGGEVGFLFPPCIVMASAGRDARFCVSTLYAALFLYASFVPPQYEKSYDA